MKILLICPSLRRESLNRKLLAVAGELLSKGGAELDRLELKDLDVPLYSQDIEDKGMPADALLVKQKMDAADAILISSPEYNFSVPGVLKNLVDWVSRTKPQPFKSKHIFLMSASPSMVGGNRGLWSLRMPLEALGAHVYPGMFSLSLAHEAFNEEGKLKDQRLHKDLEKMLSEFILYVS